MLGHHRAARASRCARSAFLQALAILLLVPSQGPARGQDLEPAAPESVGLSSQRLKRLDAAMKQEIDNGRKAGIAVLIARRSRVAHHKAFGFADLEMNTPLRKDAYFRVYSMTKPIVSAALLMLYEEGMFQLTDPLEKYVPGMKGVKVHAGEDRSGNRILETPKRTITIQDVFRHTAGFAHWSLPLLPPSNPVERAYAEAGVDPKQIDSLRQLVEEKLTRLPLLYHPGERWAYSVAHDVQAYLIERFSGMPIDRFLSDRLFGPLGMKDSFYGDPPSPGPRCTKVYGHDAAGALEVVKRPLDVPHSRFREVPIGGAGLTMTLMDYARFAQMLLNGGTLDGTRVLGPKTVDLMTINHLAPDTDIIFPGYGYGLGVGVCISPVDAGNLGSAGQYGWGGFATTWVIIDPREQLIALLFSQYVPGADMDVVNRFQTLVYQAVVE